MIRRSGQILVSDSFNRSNGYLGTSETGQSWLTGGVSTTAWDVYSNKAMRHSSTDSVNDVAYIDCGRSNVTVSANITMGSYNSGMRLIARMSGANINNCMSFHFDSAGGIRIYKRISAVETSLAVGTYSVTVGSAYACSFTCKGNEFSVSINGSSVLSAVDDNALKSNTMVGMFIPIYSAFPFNTDFMDNFVAKG